MSDVSLMRSRGSPNRTINILVQYRCECSKCLIMYQDTVSLLQPTVVALRVCGICPSALRRLHIPATNKIYMLLLVLFYEIYPFIVIPKIYEEINGISVFVSILAIICDAIRHLLLVSTAVSSSTSLIKFFRIMESVQRSLSSLNIRQPPNPTKISQMIWLLILFGPKSVSTVCQIFTMGWRIAACNAIHGMVVLGTACKIRILYSLANDKLELLNWHLDDLNNRWPVFLPRPPDVSFRELSSVREWRRTKFILESEDTRTVTPVKVKNFNKAHLKLIFALRSLNSAFSVTALAYIVPSVINMSLLIPLTLNNGFRNFYSIDFGLAVVSEIVSLVAILSISSKVQEQADKTALLVHDLLDEAHHSDEVVQELEQFSMALLHRKATFTAWGFFDVNLKLVSRMAGILAPIILFLTQHVRR